MPVSDPWTTKIGWLLFGAIISWILQQIRVAWAEDIAILNEHIKDIEKFSEAAQNYWLKKPIDIDEDKSLAARVRASHAATTLLYPYMSEACGDKVQQYEYLSVELFTKATGGNFETANRVIDPLLAIEIHDTAVRLIHLLRMSRKGLVSIRRLAKWRIDFER